MNATINGAKRTKYMIYSDGRIVSLGRNGARGHVIKDKELKQHINNNGYMRVHMTLKGRGKMYLVHRGLLRNCLLRKSRIATL